MMQVVLSIQAGKILPSKLLRELGSHSRQSKLNRAFRELGLVERTLFLLRYVSEVDFRRSIRALIKSNPTIKTESLIRLLNPKLRGWANYFRHVVSKQIFCMVDNAIFQAIYRWTRRRHSNKGAGWIFDKYFNHPAPNNWWFHAKTRTADGLADMFKLYRVASTRIVRHVKVIAEATPYDPAYT